MRLCVEIPFLLHLREFSFNKLVVFFLQPHQLSTPLSLALLPSGAVAHASSTSSGGNIPIVELGASSICCLRFEVLVVAQLLKASLARLGRQDGFEVFVLPIEGVNVPPKFFILLLQPAEIFLEGVDILFSKAY